MGNFVIETKDVRKQRRTNTTFQPNFFIVKRMIRWFEKDGKELLGEAEINDLDPHALHQAYGLVADDPMYGDYPVETKE